MTEMEFAERLALRRFAYPRGFMTPERRPVSIKTMAKALRAIRANPDADYPGWNWFEAPGYRIIAEFRRGLHERINARAELFEGDNGKG